MNKQMWLWVGIAAFGAAGSVARYGVGQLAGLVTAYPAGTMAVNILGAFAAGWVNAALEHRPGAAEAWRIVISVGLLGGFTTFSAMMLDTDRLMGSAWYRAAGYLAATLILGLAAVRLGAIVGRAL
jgi:CrcB protein